MRVIKAFEDELRGLARHRKALRNRRPLREHAGKITRRPHGWKIDAAIVEKIGIDQPRDQAEWQIVAIDGMVGNSDQPGWSSIVQKLLNLMAAFPSANGAF